MRLYHRTTLAAAEAILRDGFHEGTRVWLSNVPLDSNKEANGETLLLVVLDLDDDDVSIYEWGLHPHSTPVAARAVWSIPAEVVNEHACSVQIVKDPAIVQEDLEIKEEEYRLQGRLYEIAASAIESKNPDIDLPEQELGDLVTRRADFEARLIATCPWKRSPKDMR